MIFKSAQEDGVKGYDLKYGLPRNSPPVFNDAPESKILEKHIDRIPAEMFKGQKYDSNTEGVMRQLYDTLLEIKNLGLADGDWTRGQHKYYRMHLRNKIDQAINNASSILGQ